MRLVIDYISGTGIYAQKIKKNPVLSNSEVVRSEIVQQGEIGYEFPLLLRPM